MVELRLRKGVVPMKRMISLLLSLMLCFSVFSALAEGAASEFAKDEVKLTVPEYNLPEVELKEASQAAKTSDDVVKQNNVYTIKTPTGLTISLNGGNLSGFYILTQSYYASIDVYSSFKDDATATQYIDNLIDNNYHVVIWDAYHAFQAIAVQSAGSDALTSHVKNLAGLREADIKAVAGLLLGTEDVSNVGMYTFNGNTWIQLKANVLVTIVNSEYVITSFIPNGDSMTEDDYSDFTKFMRALTLS